MAASPSSPERARLSQSLHELPLERRAIVKAVVAAGADVPEERVRQLIDIGFLPGEVVRVLARAWPGGEPLVVSIGHSRFALRRGEAACIQVHGQSCRARHQRRDQHRYQPVARVGNRARGSCTRSAHRGRRAAEPGNSPAPRARASTRGSLAWFVFAPQCLSTLAAVRRETGTWAMPAMLAAYLFALAYAAAFITYRVASGLGAG